MAGREACCRPGQGWGKFSQLGWVESKETYFPKLSVLICEAQVVSSRNQNRLKTERNLNKILNHLPAKTQIIPLPILPSRINIILSSFHAYVSIAIPHFLRRFCNTVVVLL